MSEDKYSQPDSESRLPEDQLPENLRADLAAMFSRSPHVSGDLDRSILEAGRLTLQGVRTSRRKLATWAAAACAAACLTVAVLTLDPFGVDDARQFARADLDRSGDVDILDAFYLARHLDGGEEFDPNLDVNGDGRIDQRDVDFLAYRAVSITGSGGGR